MFSLEEAEGGPHQPRGSMATALDKRCPICLDTWSDAGYVLPCLHQFCFECIQRWAERKPKCPLCKGRVTSIVHSVQCCVHIWATQYKRDMSIMGRGDKAQGHKGGEGTGAPLP
uniref:RING-type E3 ubiquitin transferase n=1 Tax=Anser brachyrhynchus TaxID=132585 RepID=A0A8B9I6G3_9AVES